MLLTAIYRPVKGGDLTHFGGTVVGIPLETKRLLVRVALAGSVSKGILAAQAVAMARSLLIWLAVVKTR